MGLYDNYRRPLAPGDLVMHYDTGRIGFVLGFDVDDDAAVSVFILNRVRSMFKSSFSRVRDEI
jgi:hypothetical protein